MSSSQQKNFRQLKHVLMQLMGFGLNPYDWNFDREANVHTNEIRLRHRSDRDFQIAAKIERHSNGLLSLQSLYVARL